MAAKICVVGAGAIGFSTAVRIQERIPGAQVTIIAEKFSPDTVSNVAAGFLRMSNWEGQADAQLKRKWGEMTWEHIERLYTSEDASKVGMQLITGFRFNETMPESTTEYQAFRELTARERKMFPGFDEAFVQTTFLLEGGIYLLWLRKRFISQGGKWVKRKLASLKDIASDFDVIVNCSGMGASDLVNDRTMLPIRGQLELLEAPWVKHFIFDTKNMVYVFPCQKYLCVGGTYQKYPEVTDPKPRKIDRDRILANAAKILPGLKGARVIEERVGFRPTRPTVRLEKEDLYVGSKHIPVVHNYGHGAFGIILHWGCAVDATKLVEEALSKQFKAKL